MANHRPFASVQFSDFDREHQLCTNRPRVSHSIFRMLVRAQIAGKLKLCPYARGRIGFSDTRSRQGPYARTSTFGNVVGQLAA